MLVKICGITNVEDALAAETADADFIGLIFAEKSPRRVDLANAKQICTAVGGTRVVGVFQNQSIDEIESARAACGFKYVQLHGDEPPSAAAEIPDCVKAISVTSLESLHSCKDFAQHCAFVLLDKPKSPSAESNDFLASLSSWLSEYRVPCDFLVAGGLTVENVAVTLSRIAATNQPNFLGLDVASGVESSPGIKDHSLVRQFILEAKSNAVAR